MKKIIALAVASAFVAPAMAANVTISGDFEYKMVMPDGSDNSLESGDQVITFAASEELANGLTVSAKTNIAVTDVEDTDGVATDTTTTTNTQGVAGDGSDHIKVSGSFGSVSVGDVSSGLDNVGDYTDVAEQDGAFSGDGSDASILYVLPTFVDGLKLSVSHTPDGSNFAGNSASDSYSFAYSFGAGEVYYGAFEPATGDETTAFGIKYSIAGMMLAAESGEEGAVEYQGLAATYSIGDSKLFVERQEDNDGADKDQTIFGVTQSLGGGLSVYAQMTQDDKAGESDQSYLGVEYSF